MSPLHRELTRADLVDRLAGLIDAARRVAIDGPDAAGKSVLADELVAALRERLATSGTSPGQRLYFAAIRPELVADAVVYNDAPSRPSLRVRTPS